MAIAASAASIWSCISGVLMLLIAIPHSTWIFHAGHEPAHDPRMGGQPGFGRKVPFTASMPSCRSNPEESDVVEGTDTIGVVDGFDTIGVVCCAFLAAYVAMRALVMSRRVCASSSAVATCTGIVSAKSCGGVCCSGGLDAGGVLDDDDLDMSGNAW